MPNGDVTLTLIRHVTKEVETPSGDSSVPSNIGNFAIKKNGGVILYAGGAFSYTG
jgi:hypothetical protein